MICWSYDYGYELKIRSMRLHYIFKDGLIFRSYFPGMRLPWECRDQSQETSWRRCVTGPFFHKRKGILKIDRGVKMTRHLGLVWELHAPTYPRLGIYVSSIESFALPLEGVSNFESWNSVRNYSSTKTTNTSKVSDLSRTNLILVFVLVLWSKAL